MSTLKPRICSFILREMIRLPWMSGTSGFSNRVFQEIAYSFLTICSVTKLHEPTFLNPGRQLLHSKWHGSFCFNNCCKDYPKWGNADHKDGNTFAAGVGNEPIVCR